MQDLSITGDEQNKIKIWEQVNDSDRIVIELSLSDPWWKILGVDQNSSMAQVKTAYYKEKIIENRYISSLDVGQNYKDFVHYLTK